MSLIFSLLFVFNSFISILGEESLYKNGEQITILNVTSLKTTIYESESSWYVEFYASWCGHCQRFASDWKDMAQDVKDWSHVIRIAAINCGDDINNDICREFNIDAYPTLKLFPPHAAEGDLGNDTSHGAFKSLQHMMVDYIQKQNELKPKPTWPKFQYINSLEELWEESNSGVKYTVVIFEKPDSYLGKLVMLDLVSYPEICVRRMSDEYADKYGVQQMPSAYISIPGGKLQMIIQSGNRSDFTAVLCRLIGVEPNNIYPDDIIKNDHGVQHMESMRHVSGVHLQDLLSGIHYSLRHEVSGHQSIDGDKLAALKNYVHILMKFFPGPAAVNGFLHALHNRLQQVKDSISGKDWLNMTYDVQTSSAYLPETSAWSGCRGSKKHLRGYPCSLWAMFHTLTVSAHHRLDQGHTDDVEGKHPLEVLGAMRGYIGEFFSCRECRDHFITMTKESLERNVTSTYQAVMWLWRAHNHVNARLVGDVTEDLTSPKIQFPSQSMCTACWKTVGDSEELILDEDMVFSFLKRFYDGQLIVQDFNMTKTPFNSEESRKQREEDWREWKKRSENKLSEDSAGIVDPVMHERMVKPLKHDVKHDNISSTTWLGFSFFDTSLCVIFYMFCVFLLIFGYFKFMTRNRVCFRMFSRAKKTWYPPV